MSARYDRIMLSQRFCSSRTVRRLDHAEFRVFVAALCLAGQSPVRGKLLIAEGEGLAVQDLADEAMVKGNEAKRAVKKLLQLGVLEESDGVLSLPNWARYNPTPKPSETREAWRERKRRQRQSSPRGGHG